MIPARLSANTDRNAPLKDPFPRLTADETNDAWLQRVLAGPLKDRRGPFVLLVGGAALSHFRVRVAQSHARIDLLPSYWSHCALVQRDAGPGRRHVVRHVPFDLRGDIDDMPARNGVERADITAFADPKRYPNLALLAFGVIPPEVEETAVKALGNGRLTEDLVSPLVPWLAFIWGAGPNPLLAGTPVPAALYVSALFASAHVDLTPGLSERVACPEAIWQAALWWREYYQHGAADADLDGAHCAAPTGAYVIDQPAAAAVEFPGAEADASSETDALAGGAG